MRELTVCEGRQGWGTGEGGAPRLAGDLGEGGKGAQGDLPQRGQQGRGRLCAHVGGALEQLIGRRRQNGQVARQGPRAALRYFLPRRPDGHLKIWYYPFNG